MLSAIWYNSMKVALQLLQLHLRKLGTYHRIRLPLGAHTGAFSSEHIILFSCLITRLLLKRAAAGD